MNIGCHGNLQDVRRMQPTDKSLRGMVLPTQAPVAEESASLRQNWQNSHADADPGCLSAQNMQTDVFTNAWAPRPGNPSHMMFMKSDFWNVLFGFFGLCLLCLLMLLTYRQYFNAADSLVKYGFVLDTNTFPSLTELVWCTGTNEVLSKSANLLILLVSSVAAGKIKQALKSIWIQNNYVFYPGLPHWSKRLNMLWTLS